MMQWSRQFQSLTSLNHIAEMCTRKDIFAHVISSQFYLKLFNLVVFRDSEYRYSIETVSCFKCWESSDGESIQNQWLLLALLCGILLCIFLFNRQECLHPVVSLLWCTSHSKCIEEESKLFWLVWLYSAGKTYFAEKRWKKRVQDRKWELGKPTQKVNQHTSSAGGTVISYAASLLSLAGTFQARYF